LIAKRTDIRLWTAIVMIGIGGFSVTRGLGIVQFSLAMSNIDSSDRRAEVINTWGSAPDVASTALQSDLNYQINPADQKAADRRRQTISELVSIRPLSSYGWLSLSGLQLITDQPMEQVFDSLELSMLTGPNEGNVMAERGIYGVSLWQRLPPDLKRRVSADLTVAEPPDIQKIRAFVIAQPQEVQNEVREALSAAGLSPKEIEKRTGF
jgi:hypothetical protein